MTASATTRALLPSIAAGGIAVLVGFVSSIAIIFQAALTAGATPEQTSSWLFALCLGAGVISISFSLYYKMPILAAWSTPGAALLGTSLLNVPINEAIGAFILCGALITLSGVTGLFERMVSRIPIAIAAAMLAGILLRFGLDMFASIKTQPLLVLAMLVTYFAAKRYYPRYAVIGVLVVGLTVAVATGQLHFDGVAVAPAHPVFIMPVWSWSVLLSVGVPLFVVTMASQNLPGVAVMKASGYHPPVSMMITGTGLATLFLAPFGAFGINMAAITAAICTSEEAHKDPSQRYVAAVSAGVVYLILGLFSAMISGVFSAFPKELILALSGIALLATIANSLTAAVREDKHREAAVITFLVTASGLSLFGIGAAFWGLVAGTVALGALRPRPLNPA